MAEGSEIQFLLQSNLFQIEFWSNFSFLFLLLSIYLEEDVWCCKVETILEFCIFELKVWNQSIISKEKKTGRNIHEFIS